jgi:Spy/CpxP family protein refolding chaperone
MRLVRIAALGVLLAIGGASAAAAQGGGGGGQGRGGTAMLLRGIEVDEATKAKIDSISAKYRAEMGPMTPGQPPDSATMAKRREIQTKQYADIRKLLNADQQKVFDANVEEMRNRRGRGGQG